MSEVNEPAGAAVEDETVDAGGNAAGGDPSTVDSKSDPGVSDGETVETPADASADVPDSGTGSAEETDDSTALDAVPSDVEPDVTGANQVAADDEATTAVAPADEKDA